MLVEKHVVEKEEESNTYRTCFSQGIGGLVFN